MHINYAGLSTGKLGVDNEEVPRKFESFGARIEAHGAYDEVAAWFEDN